MKIAGCFGINQMPKLRKFGRRANAAKTQFGARVYRIFSR